ncbi:MAG TPA: phosphotransferase family protein [Pseudonocardia sp.]|jgi:aminoglycoside phosphotransferase (APT) family kinase protein
MTGTPPPDAGVLADWLDKTDVAFSGPLAVELIAGGRSNLTYALTDARDRRMVLRRPPGGILLDSAHDMHREWRFIDALQPTPVPVPEPLVYCDDPSVIGAPFYVMGFVDGVVIESHEVALRVPTEVRLALGPALIETMAALHAVDVTEVGLIDIAKGEDYLARQLRRWMRQWELSIGPAGIVEPLMEGLHADLVRLAPPQHRTGIVHGDFRLGNVISGMDGTIRAVLDWELATLGDPLADLGWLLASWRLPEDGDPDPDSPGSATEVGGFCGRDLLIERYASRTGTDPDQVDYYIAFACWRMACILSGVSARYQAGSMGEDGVDPAAHATVFARRIGNLATRARALLG